MVRPSPRNAVVGILIASVVLGTVAPTALANSHAGPLPAGEVFDASDRVDAWERAGFTLRSETGTAPVQVPNAFWQAEAVDGRQHGIGRDPVAVYDRPGTITLQFEDARGGSLAFSTGIQHAELIRAYLDEDVNATTFPTGARVLDLVTGPNANDNATFAEVAPSVAIDGSGEASVSDTLTDPGHYVYFLALNETGADGFVVNAGELSTDGNVTVIGVEHVAVRSGDPTVVAQPVVVRGNNATITVTQPGVSTPPTTFTHILALYHEPTYVNAQFTVQATAEVDRNFTLANDTLLNSSIEHVNGVADLEDDTTVFGADLSDGNVTGTAGIDAILDFIAEGAQQPPPSTAVSDDERLDASIQSFEAGPSPGKPFQVRTLANWTGVNPSTSASDNYRWLYLAVSEDNQVFTAETGTITVLNTTPPPTVTTGGGGGGAGAPAQPRAQPAPNRVVFADFRVVGNQLYSLDIPRLVADDETEEEADDVQLQRITFSSFSGRTVDIVVTKYRNPPTGTPAVDGGVNGLRYFDISHGFPEDDLSSLAFHFRVRKGLLDRLGQSADDIALFRFNGGSWADAETTIVDEDDEFVYFVARPPGLSVFAVGTYAPAFSVADANLEPTQVATGDPVTVTATIENAGPGGGTYTANLTVDGTVVDTQTVEVPPGDTRRVSFTRTFDAAGDYEVSVGGIVAGRLVVAEPTATPAPPTPPSTVSTAVTTTDSPAITERGGGQLTAIVVIAVLVLTIAGLALYRRRLQRSQ